MNNEFENNEKVETEEIEEVQDILNTNTDDLVDEYKRPEVKKEKKNRGGFGRGLFFGIVITLLVVTLAGVIASSYIRRQGLVLTTYKLDENLTGHLLSQQMEEKVSEILSALSAYYYEDIDSDKVAEGMFKGIVDSLGDKYTVYYTEKEYQDFMMDTQGVYYGIGALLSQDKTTLVISIDTVYKGSPAEEAGLQSGDIIVSADGIAAEGQELSSFVENIRGAENTKVTLVINRNGEEMTFEVIRRKVDVPTIESAMFPDNIGYIRITQFDEVTASQFKEALNGLKKDGMEALIVDVRSNPGGLLSSVTEILDELLPEGLLVYTENKSGQRVEYNSYKGELGKPMCVLVNGNSASASEIFAGAIKDYEYGTLIGTNTFGKGIVQGIVPFKDGSAIKVTTSRYYTPKGNYIHGVGIAPDIELEYEFLGGENDKYDYSLDNQIQKAVEVLKEKMGK